MSKVTWKPGTLLAPVPAVMVSCGTMEKPNIITVAWTGIVNSDPAMTYVSVRKERFSHELIFEKRRVRDQSDYFRPGPRDRLVRRQIRPEYRQIRIGKTGAGASFSAVLPHDRPEPPISGMQGYPGAAFGLP